MDKPPKQVIGNKNRNLVKLLLCSSLVHLLLIWLLYSQSPTTKKFNTAKHHQPLKAYVLLAAPSKTTVHTPPVDTAPLPAIKAKPQPSKGSAQLKRHHNNKQKIIKTQDKTKNLVASSTDRTKPLHKALGRYLQQQDKQQINNIARQASLNYQRQQRSPDLRLPAAPKTLSADQQLQEQISHKIDCGSSVNKTLALLSGLSGGTIRCRQRAKIKHYIHRRVQKTDQ